jgi:hypothetical protein
MMMSSSVESSSKNDKKIGVLLWAYSGGSRRKYWMTRPSVDEEECGFDEWFEGRRTVQLNATATTTTSSSVVVVVVYMMGPEFWWWFEVLYLKCVNSSAK